MASKSGTGAYRPPEGSRNPADYPGGRVPNYFDGLTGEQVVKELDARVDRLFEERYTPIITKHLDAMIAKRLESAALEFVEGVEPTLRSHKEGLDYLEKRLSEALFFRGVWSADGEYGPGSLVQHGGTVWVAKDGATGKPGTEGSGWRLLVKSPKGQQHDDGE